MKVFTQADWKQGFKRSIEIFVFDHIGENDDQNKIEISEEVYDNFLCSLPPIYIKNGFQNSEPTDHRNGKMVYNTFITEKDDFGIDKFFYVGEQVRGVTPDKMVKLGGVAS